VVAGTVVLWSHDFRDQQISETGWMVLPEFQGRGVGKAATRMLLEAAKRDGRWGTINAFPAKTNGPSNGICRSLGFDLIEECDLTSFTGALLHTNRWILDLQNLPEL